MAEANAKVEMQLLLASTGGSISFEAFAAKHADARPDELAELIELHARERLRLGLPVHLSDYLDAIPNLREMEVALDAAIDMALRSLSGSSRPTEEAVDALASSYPQIARQIRDAATLSGAMWSTSGSGPSLRGPAYDLPCDFGPYLPDGQRQYELIELLGTGAFGRVYLAVDRQFRDPERPALVAIKVFGSTGRDAWSRQRFADEAAKARRVDHPNAVRVLNRGVTEDRRDFIVFDYVRGGTLHDVLAERDEAPSPREAAVLVAKVARAVEAVHAAGLVHCDLKPANVLINPDGEPMLTDFGLAMRQSEGGDEFERLGAAGTLAFMAPEQYRLESGSLGPAVDIYALGGMLYWLLTRRLPNGSTEEEVARTHDSKQGRREPPRLTGGPHRIDRDLEAICRRALDPDPRARYSSAGRLADDLELWLARRPVPWTEPTPAHRLRLLIKRRPRITLASAAALLAVLSASAIALHHYTQYADGRARLQASHRLLVRSHEFQERWSEQGLLGVQLANLASMSNIFGARALDDLEAHRWAEERQQETIREMLSSAVADGRSDHAEVHSWRVALGARLLRSGHPGEALLHLLPARSFWAGLLPPDDSFVASVDALIACAEADLMIQSGRASAEDVEAMVRRLESCEGLICGSFDEGFLRVEVLERLFRLHDSFLDDPAEKRRIAVTLRQAQLTRGGNRVTLGEWHLYYDEQPRDAAHAPPDGARPPAGHVAIRE